MDEGLTHSVTITLEGNYPHGPKTHATVTVSGGGDLGHMVTAFKAALLAAGFGAGVVECLEALDG